MTNKKGLQFKTVSTKALRFYCHPHLQIMLINLKSAKITSTTSREASMAVFDKINWWIKDSIYSWAGSLGKWLGRITAIPGRVLDFLFGFKIKLTHYPLLDYYNLDSFFAGLTRQIGRLIGLVLGTIIGLTLGLAFCWLAPFSKRKDPQADSFIKIMENGSWGLAEYLLDRGLQPAAPSFLLKVVNSLIIQKEPLNTPFINKLFSIIDKDYYNYTDQELTSLVAGLAKLGRLYSEEPFGKGRQTIKKASLIELYRIKKWLSFINEQLQAQTPYEKSLQELIKGINSYIDRQYRAEITYEHLYRLIQVYDQRPPKSFLQSLRKTKEEDQLFKLREFLIKRAAETGSLSSEDLQELYQLIQMRKLSTPVKLDLFHKPHDLANRIFFQLAWLLGRIDGMDINSMIPPYDKGSEDWWERVGSQPHRSHLYEISYSDLYLDEMSSEDSTPPIYSVRELKAEYQSKAALVRNRDQLNPKVFTNKQMQTLFRDRPDFGVHCRQIHAAELGNVKRIRKETVDTLEKLFHDLYSYSDHHWKSIFRSKFDIDKANEFMAKLLTFLDSLPPEEKNAVGAFYYHDSTFKDYLKNVQRFGCIGQVGEHGQEFVKNLRNHHALAHDKKPLPSRYSRHLALLESKAKSEPPRLPGIK